MPDATHTTATTGAADLTSAQQSQNLHTASHLVAAQLGVDPANLDYNQRIVYNRALAIVITTYPARFSDVTVSNAQATLKKNFTPLEKTGFDVSAFGSAIVDNAVVLGNKVGSAASSGLDAVSNTFGFLKYALPVIVVGGLAFYVYNKTKTA
jgi:hypothetical protein